MTLVPTPESSYPMGWECDRCGDVARTDGLPDTWAVTLRHPSLPALHYCPDCKDVPV